MLCLVILLGYWLHIENRSSDQRLWIVYNMRHHTAVEYFHGHTSVLMVDSALYADSARMDYVSDNLLTRLRIRHRTMLPYNKRKRMVIAGNTVDIDQVQKGILLPYTSTATTGH